MLKSEWQNIGYVEPLNVVGKVSIGCVEPRNIVGKVSIGCGRLLFIVGKVSIGYGRLLFIVGNLSIGGGRLPDIVENVSTGCGRLLNDVGRFLQGLLQLNGLAVAERARSLGVAGMVTLAEGNLRTSMNEVPPTEVVGHILDV